MDRFLDAFRAHAGALDAGVAQPRLANIASFDPANHAVRVRLQPEGVLTGWMPLGASMVGDGIGIVHPPGPNDQVLVVPQEGDGDTWHVVSRIYHQGAMPPVSEATGKPVQSGEVGIFTKGAWIHLTGGIVHLKAAEIRSEGLWKHKGDIELDGKLTATGVLKSLADVVAVAVSLLQHRHASVRSGSDTSGPPQQ